MPNGRSRSSPPAPLADRASGYAVRKARIADTGRLLEIERSAGQAFLTIPNLAWLADDDVLSQSDHRRLIDYGAIWVAVDCHDLPVGFLCGEEKDDDFHIWQLAVRHDLQGRGIGTALIAAAKDWAVTRQMAALSLTTFRDIAWNAPFYAKLGFALLAERDLPDRLRLILLKEAAAGLAVDRRCAMLLSLPSN